MMNDDDYWFDAMKKLVYTYNSVKNTPSWARPAWFDSTELGKLYERAKEEIQMRNSKYEDYGYYDTRVREVAKAAIEALENGTSLETLIESNSKVQSWYREFSREREAARARALRDKERRKKAAEKKKLEDAKRAEAAAKLTDEELVAFGLRKDGYHKR